LWLFARKNQFGDKEHTVDKILKVTTALDRTAMHCITSYTTALDKRQQVTKLNLYHSLINEAKIFNLMNIDTQVVLKLLEPNGIFTL
jgi:hypothetical protein